MRAEMLEREGMHVIYIYIYIKLELIHAIVGLKPTQHCKAVIPQFLKKNQ